MSGTFDSYGTRLVSSDISTPLRARIVENTLSGTFTDKAIAVRAEDNATADIRIRRNTLSGTVDSVGIEVIALDDASITGRVDGNDLTGSFVNGIVIDARDSGVADTFGSSIKLELENNDISGTLSGYGIHLRSRSEASLTITEFNNNVISSSVGTAIRMQNTGSMGVFGFGTTNQVLNATSFEVDFSGSPTVDFFLDRVQIILPLDITP